MGAVQTLVPLAIRVPLAVRRAAAQRLPVTLRVVGASTAAAGGAALGRRVLSATPPGGGRRWERTNFRGSTVSLTGGPAAAAGAMAGMAVATAMSEEPLVRGAVATGVVGCSAAVGLYDDLAGATSTKGFKGHLSALARGEVTSGAVKIVVIGTGGLAVGAVRGSNPLDALVIGGVVAGSANLMNLFDLRPGRALKVTALAGAPLLLTDGGPQAAAALGSSTAMLGPDLGEQTMLGDCGANALGATLGVALASGLAPKSRLAALGVLVGLTAASEKVSFSKVIERTPGLRELDRLGRAG